MRPGAPERKAGRDGRQRGNPRNRPPEYDSPPSVKMEYTAPPAPFRPAAEELRQPSPQDNASGPADRSQSQHLCRPCRPLQFLWRMEFYHAYFLNVWITSHSPACRTYDAAPCARSMPLASTARAAGALSSARQAVGRVRPIAASGSNFHLVHEPYTSYITINCMCICMRIEYFCMAILRERNRKWQITNLQRSASAFVGA